jgi:hypothetical protein
MFLRQYLKESGADEKATQYFASFVDLADDGHRQVIVFFTDQHSCGSGGCTTLILAPKGSSYRVVTKVAIAWPPIYVLPTKSNGWHDIAVRVQGGGIQPGYEVKLSFNGKKYPSNPSMASSQRLVGQVSGTLVVPTDPKGTPLY